MEEFTERVGKFFDNYKESFKDSKELVKLVANPEIYDVLLQLRAGPISKENIINKNEIGPKKNLMEILDILKSKKIIDEFDYHGETKLLLLDDILFTTSFPQYLMKYKPKKSESNTHDKTPTTRKSFRRKIKSKASTPSKTSGLENLGEEVYNKLKKISKEKSIIKKEEQDD
jgi:hypothetical protein